MKGVFPRVISVFVFIYRIVHAFKCAQHNSSTASKKEGRLFSAAASLLCVGDNTKA